MFRSRKWVINLLWWLGILILHLRASKLIILDFYSSNSSTPIFSDDSVRFLLLNMSCHLKPIIFLRTVYAPGIVDPTWPFLSLLTFDYRLSKFQEFSIRFFGFSSQTLAFIIIWFNCFFFKRGCHQETEFLHIFILVKKTFSLTPIKYCTRITKKLLH